ncbi:MAG: CoA-binding protein [Balneolaceae bacterium]|nr:CoA-binding protein [Balneolaceae bacterium]
MKGTFNNWYTTKTQATEELARESREIETLLENIRAIAIVGISRNPHRDSQYVGKYLKSAGYKVVPVNPAADTILGEKSYPNLQSIPFSIDVVDIFRRPKDIPAVVDEALSINPKAIWLQLGTGSHPKLQKKVESAGSRLIQKRCIKVDHQFLIRPKNQPSKLAQ